MAHLSTHVLDTARGLPAGGVKVLLHAVRGEDRALVATATTNADGRTDGPLLTGDTLQPGVYELAFHVGDYFRRTGTTLADPPFLDVVLVRIGIADAARSYHVPLLVSPYGYSTYRGS
jgi:5-hydroxyisourate hydrolase